MKRFTTILASVLVLVGCSSVVENPILEIDGGKVQGVATETPGVTVYRGIPYAAAPVGENRWKDPQPVTPWEGVMIADTWGNPAIQEKHTPENTYTSEFFFEGDPEYSEDCLQLNVWTPAPGKTDAKLPVAFWIHGGAYTSGWGFEREMDGEAWAERGVVLVTINYRLGIFGFLAHPLLSQESAHGVSGNYGILDQIAALKWVTKNIEQFGGDPDNIMIFGQSAGAGSVQNLVTSPLTGNMIKKAVIMSGGGVSDRPILGASADNSELIANAKTIFDWAGYDTLEKMREASAEDIYTVVSRYAEQNGKSLRITSGPIIDNYVNSESFNSAALEGRIKNIPYMMGSVMDDLGPLGNGVDAFCLLREKAGIPAYAYQFARPLPDTDPATHAMKGAFHSSELWYIFHTLKNSDRPFVDADDALSLQMVDAWTNFAKTGNPNGTGEQVWTPFTENNTNYMVFKLNDNCTEVSSAMGERIPSSLPNFWPF